MAWLVSIDSDGKVISSQLPLLPLVEGDQPVRQLLGHVGRSHSLCERWQAQPRTAILFQGPHSYVSPSWYSNRSSAPTWCYVNAAVTADITVRPDLTDIALERLVDRMETELPDRWQIDEVANRYEALRDRIVAFVADIVDVDARFKLAQDESEDAVRETINALGGHPLAHWMRDFNADRLDGIA